MIARASVTTQVSKAIQQPFGVGSQLGDQLIWKTYPAEVAFAADAKLRHPS